MQFIAAKKAEFPVSLLCSTLEVSTTGFYAWQTRPPSRRTVADAALTAHIEKIHPRTKCTYGAPRVHAQLRHEGVRVGRERVQRR